MAFLQRCTTFSRFFLLFFFLYTVFIASTWDLRVTGCSFLINFIRNPMCLIFPILFTSSRLPRVQHPALESPRTHIPAVLAHSKAPCTFKTYHGCFKRWKSWASGFSGITYFPAQEEHVDLYLISLVRSGSSYSSIQQAFYSISFFFFIMLVGSRILVNQLSFWLSWKVVSGLPRNRVS